MKLIPYIPTRKKINFIHIKIPKIPKITILNKFRVGIEDIPESSLRNGEIYRKNYYDNQN